MIILTGSFFDSSEKPELIKAIDKPAAIHSQSWMHSMDVSAV